MLYVLSMGTCVLDTKPVVCVVCAPYGYVCAWHSACGVCCMCSLWVCMCWILCLQCVLYVLCVVMSFYRWKPEKTSLVLIYLCLIPLRQGFLVTLELKWSFSSCPPALRLQICCLAIQTSHYGWWASELRLSCLLLKCSYPLCFSPTLASYFHSLQTFLFPYTATWCWSLNEPETDSLWCPEIDSTVPVEPTDFHRVFF